jgi:hypothetical protein
MMKKFALLLLLAFVAVTNATCFDVLEETCPGKKCCEVSCAGNNYGPWCHVCMDKCGLGTLGEVNTDLCKK